MASTLLLAVGMKSLIVMPFALFAATALLPACSKSIPAKRYHTVANLEHNSDFTVEIEGQSATGKSYVLVNGIVKDGTPVKVTYQTVCGERSVTFPFVRDTGSIAPRDRENVNIPIDKLPTVTFVRIDPSLNAPVKIGPRTVTAAEILEDGSGWVNGYFLDVGCGGNITVGSTTVAVPPNKSGDSLFIANSPTDCYEVSENHYCYAIAAPPPPPISLRGAHAYWVNQKIDYFLKPVEHSVKSYVGAEIRTALEKIECPK